MDRNPAYVADMLDAARDILAHRYERIEHEVLYHTMRGDLPGVVTALEIWLAMHPPSDPTGH